MRMTIFKEDLALEVALAREELASWSRGEVARTAQPSGATAAPADPAALSVEGDEAPTTFALGAVYPNPARGAAMIPLALADQASVRITVYDALGREVMVLTEGAHEAGRYQIGLAASVLAPGLYLVQATVHSDSAERVFTRRLTVVR